MTEAIITELERSVVFKANIDSVPVKRENFSIIYVDEKEVKLPGSAQVNGVISVTVTSNNAKILAYINSLYESKKRFNIMLEAENNVFLVKGCYIKQMKSEAEFELYYNSFK